MKIAVLGAGAMGSIYGGYLSRSNEVWLVDVWKDHVDTVNQKGLVILEGEEECVFRPRAASSGAQVGCCDLVLVFVKSVNTGEALAGNRELFGPDTLALSLQNGYGNAEDLLEYLPAANVLIGTTQHGGNMQGPGRVQHNGAGKTYIGVQGGDFANARRIAELMSDAGLNGEAAENVMEMIWSKLLANAGSNATTALLGVRNEFVLQSAPMEFLMDQFLREGIRVAQAEGIPFEEEATIAKTKEGLRKVGANRSSMLQDVATRRRTEILRINGAIARLGERHGIETPYNTAITKLILAMEDAYDCSERFSK